MSPLQESRTALISLLANIAFWIIWVSFANQVIENVPIMNLDSSTSYHVAGGSCNLERLILKTACQQCFARLLCNLSGQNVFIVGLWLPGERGPLWALTTLGEPSKTIITLTHSHSPPAG